MFINKILLIHNDKDYSSAITNLFNSNYDIKCTNNYSNSLLLLKNYTPTLILLELNFSTNSSTFDTVIAFKKDTHLASIPIIVLSDTNNENIITNALLVGATDYYLITSDLSYLSIKVNIYFNKQLNNKNPYTGSLYEFPEKQNKYTHEQDFKIKFDALINELTFENEVSASILAKKMLTSVSTLERWTKKVYGLPPMKYIVNIKLDKAMYLLTQENYKIKEVVDLLGFTSISYFSSCFKKKFGTSPSSFKAEIELKQLK
jgi:AraC-like DNA-binding protein